MMGINQYVVVEALTLREIWLALQGTALLSQQESKLTLGRWPVVFAVGPVKFAIHWPGWPVKIKILKTKLLSLTLNG